MSPRHTGSEPLGGRALAFFAVMLLAAGIALAGCGGGSEEKKGEQAGEEAENAQAEALAKIPDADRTAFFQLATAIGTLRARAAPVAVGSSDRLSSPAEVRQARARVAKLHPEDSLLSGLRGRLVPVLGAFAQAPLSGSAGKRAARIAIARADRIEAGLRRYSRQTPAIGGAIPD